MKNIFMLLIVFSAFLQACDKCNIDYHFIDNNSLTFRLFGKTSKKQLLGLGGRYNVNEIKILDETSKERGSVRADGFGYVFFLTNQDFDLPSGTQVRRQFYLYLSPTDTDTITVDFVKSVDDCGYDNLSSAQFRYNDSLYTNVSCCYIIDFYK
jgi:hypothetical protein